MMNLNEFREVCKLIEGLVVPLLAAVLILWWLLHDSQAIKRVEKQTSPSEIERVLREFLRPEVHEMVKEILKNEPRSSVDN